MSSLALYLSDWEVEEMWSLHKMGYTYKQLAERYGVSVKTVQRIFKRRKERK